MQAPSPSPVADSDPASTWARLEALFEAAGEAEDHAAREALIAAAALSPGDEAELRSLLAHHVAATAAGFLSPAPERRGQRLGAWEVVRRLGSGGMGEVFEVRRADGHFEGRAAAKLIKRGMDSQAVLARFAQERRLLARLEHPHIARLLDAGQSADGLPFFVMEFVDGRPLDEAARALPLAARLQLFLQLCEAVAFAHRQLLVHRDLKPGNVLVDAEGRVKLLDFGIAKALDPLDAGEAGATLSGGALTPHYASPEQVRGEPVGTATDIYSLGALLYRLLTGVRPTGQTASTPQQAARSVLEETPTRPSRLPLQGADDPAWPATRARLAGDLDNIVLKALEKEPVRRYASVDALAADLRAYLDGYPVSARPPSWHYRSGKWLRRNRLAAGLGALALLSLLAGMATTLWQAQQARRAQQLAEQRLDESRRITHGLVFGFGDAVEYLPGGQALKLQLLRDTQAALTRLRRPGAAPADDAALNADLMQLHVRLAEAQMPGYPNSLNQPEAAAAEASAAAGLVMPLWAMRRHDAEFASYAARAQQLLATLEQEAGRPEQAVRLTREGLARTQEALALTAPRGVPRLRLLGAQTATQLHLGQLLDDNGVGLGRPTEALQAYAAALRSLQSESAMDAEIAELEARTRAGHTRFRAELGQTRAVILGSMASSLQRRGDFEAAAARRAESLQALREAQAQHPEQIQFWESLATALALAGNLALQRGEPAQALAWLQESMDWNRRLREAEPGHAGYREDAELRALNLGTALLRLGREAEARPWLQRGLAYWEAERARADNARARRSLDLARLRWAASQRNGAALQRQADALQAAALQEAGSSEAWLAAAEAAQWQVRLGQRERLPAACAAWQRAAALKPLPPQAAQARASLGCPASESDQTNP